MRYMPMHYTKSYANNGWQPREIQQGCHMENDCRWPIPPTSACDLEPFANLTILDPYAMRWFIEGSKAGRSLPNQNCNPE
mmetsp:Transcript_22525/g.48830  ORF Transcript_22525/g.48830 Transcript_22525/m.48830 type:complete len:80 (-) Transcript_22525:314-553(-)